jgi:hypothetical protein
VLRANRNFTDTAFSLHLIERRKNLVVGDHTAAD